MAEDAFSSISIVSSESAASSVFQPKPPGGPKPTSQGFARSSKVAGRVVRSPYLATSTPLVREHRQDHDSSDTFAHHGVPMVWESPPSVPHPSVSTFLQSLMKTPGFSAVVAPRRSSRRKGGASHAPLKSSHLLTVAAVTSAPSTHLDAIQLRDEVLHLRKEMNTLKKEKDIAKAQQIRLSKEIVKKDKQIEDLMAAGRVTTRDATRSLTTSSASKNSSTKSNKSGNNAVLVTSLRQQVHSLERALREREREVGELKRGVAASQLREVEVKAETYYREICRLNHILQDYFPAVEAGPGVNTQPITPRSASEAHIKLKALNQATIKMSSQIEFLEEENRALKRKLEMTSFGTSSVSTPAMDERGSIGDKYQDHNRTQMLAVTVELEMECSKLKQELESLLKENSINKRLNEKKEKDLRMELVGASSKVSILESQVSTYQNTEAKLKNVIGRLKEDRTHYREAAEHTQSELQSVQRQLGKEEVSREEIARELQAVQDDYQREMLAIEHSRKLAKKRVNALSLNKQKQNGAASTIQQHWRRRQAMAKQEKFQREKEDSIVDIQTALKAHLARKKIMSSKQFPDSGRSSEEEEEEEADSDDSSDAIQLLQSAMKGYLTRQMVLQDQEQKNEVIDHGPERSRDYITSSLSRYHPPLHTPNHVNLSQINQRTTKSKTSPSPWRGYVQLEGEENDEDFHQVHSRAYMASSTESEPHDPDHCLLMDEF